jgi:hypothetical protein
MTILECLKPAAWFKTRRRKLLGVALLLAAVPVAGAGLVLVFWTLPVFRGHLVSVFNPNAARGIVYFHDVERSVPWSMHVVKVSRARKDLELDSLLGRGTNLGMGLVSEQVKHVPPEWGRPVAAVNGDLYNEHPDYPGDPEGLQITHGELVSGPSTNRVCFWIDADGRPHRADVRSRFAVTWPDGNATPIGLNEARHDQTAVLYTAALGESTRTHGGLELVLERDGDSTWLPLQAGRTYSARVRELRTAGDTPLTRDTLVLSLGPGLLKPPPKVAAGDRLTLSTATTPDLINVRTAIGGGPTLVTEGRAKAWSGVRLRHPRTAIGWNQDHFFLVVVDGRQLRVSAGMTFPELADYLVKLGCQEAMALDGGGSATCWAFGNVMNSPSQGRERPAANGLVVLQNRRR